MKKHWKLILGVLLALGGLSLLVEDIAAALCGIVIGAALIAWWAWGRKNPKAAAAPLTTLLRDDAPKAEDEIIHYIPQRKDGAPIAYTFQPTEFKPAGGADPLAIYAHKEKYVDAAPNGDIVELRFEGVLFGQFESPKIAGMLMDWLNKGDPYSTILRKPGNAVTFVFYKDKRKGQESREQTVTPLVSYKSAAKQETISLLSEGDEIDLEEDFNRDGKVTASYNGDPIGDLPKKIADRFMAEGAYAAFFEGSQKTETEDFETIEAPTIRIFW